MPYQYAQNNNNAAGLATIDPQPATPGPDTRIRRYATGGAVYADGVILNEFRFDRITPTQYKSLLTTFGLSSTTIYKACTVRVTVNGTQSGGCVERDFANYNATIVLPVEGQTLEFSGGFYIATFELRDMEAL